MLASIATMGSFAAIGDSDGTVSMMSLCRALWDPTHNPKEMDPMGAIFERETLREKNLSTAKTLADKRKDGAAGKGGKEKVAEKLEKQLIEIEEKFFATVSEGDNAKLDMIKQRGPAETAGAAAASGNQ